MNTILNEYQKHGNQKKHISVLKVLRIAVYASISIFLIYLVYKGSLYDKTRVERKPKTLEVEVGGNRV